MHTNDPPRAGATPAFLLSRSPGWWLLLLLLAAFWFGTLGTRHLLNPDEGRYAEIPREMLVSGDWVTPRLNGLKYFEKPPLQYWMTAIAYQAFGQHDFTARLWTGLTGFVGILLAGFTARRLFGREAGLMAAAITASSALYLVIGHINTLDMGLSFFLQVMVCAFLLAQQAQPRSAAERGWMLVSWAAAALAFLSKGLVALVLPALTLLLYTVVTREFSAWRRLHLLLGLALFLALALPWLVLVARANPEFLSFFFLHEQFARFLTNNHDRDGPLWYFVPYVILGTLPWTWVALRRCAELWQRERDVAGLQVRRFLMLWVLVVFGFFSLSHSKLPPYIVPLIPMVGMLLGDALTRLPTSALRRHLLVMGGTLAALSVLVLLLPDTIAGAKSIDVVADLRPETTTGFAAAALGLLLAWRWARRYSTTVVVLLASASMVLGMSILVKGADALDRSRSGHALAQQLAALLPAGVSATVPIYSLRNYDQTLPFYLQRLITLVDYRGELDFGLNQDPQLGIADLGTFIQRWHTHSAVAVMPPALYAELLDQGLPMRVIARQPKLVAVTQPE